MTSILTKNKAVFLDRDGTIIELVHYLNKVEQVKLEKGSSESIKKLKENGFQIYVVSNQSAIARGYLDKETLIQINKRIQDLLRDECGTSIDGFYYCTHHPDDNCECRKPKPTLLLNAAKEHNLDLTKSFMIGDFKTDILAGVNAGCKTILVKTGYGEEEANNISNWSSKPNYIASSLTEATNWILKENS
ncbi:MAG: D-glycero-alpha-D-manno-heptose-1,7-bisphosphate 7-phosphatase [Candidatus Ranarchaeia archaeon]